MFVHPQILVECRACDLEQVWHGSNDQYCYHCSDRMGAFSIAICLNEESQRSLAEKRSLRLIEESREEVVVAA